MCTAGCWVLGEGSIISYAQISPYSISFHVFAACLSYGVLYYFLKFNLTSIQIRCVRQKRLFFSNEIGVCRHKVLFLRTKVSQSAFNFSQMKSRFTLYCAGNNVRDRWILLLLMLLILSKNWS